MTGLTLLREPFRVKEMRPRALRIRACVALTAFVGSLALPFLAARHLTFDDDAACGLETLSIGHTRTQFEAAQPTAPFGHCPLCHWLRAVSGARPGPAVQVTARLDVVASRTSIVRQGHGTSVPIDRPSRAPPAPLG